MDTSIESMVGSDGRYVVFTFSTKLGAGDRLRHMPRQSVGEEYIRTHSHISSQPATPVDLAGPLGRTAKDTAPDDRHVIVWGNRWQRQHLDD